MMTTPFNICIFCTSLQFFPLGCSASNARTLESIHIGLANEAEMRRRRGGLRLGIGRDSANDVGADGDGADAIANINNVCFVGGREDDDDQSGRGRRRFIQQTQKMGEKCDERAYQHGWFSSQQPFAQTEQGYLSTFRLLPGYFFWGSCEEQPVIKNSSTYWS